MSQAPRAKTDMREQEANVKHALALILAALDPDEGSELDTAFYTVLTHCDLAFAVMRKTNPSRVRSEIRTLEIKARMDGLPVYRLESQA
jgi:hypothetical protein